MEFLINNWLSIVTLVGGAIAFLSERAKRREEVLTAKGDAVEKMRSLYLSFVEDSEKKMQEFRSTIAELEEALEISSETNKAQAKVIEGLRAELKAAKEAREALALELEAAKSASADIASRIGAIESKTFKKKKVSNNETEG